MDKKWTNNQLSDLVYKGIVETKVHGNYDLTRCNLRNGCPVIGIGSWTGSDADDILDVLEDGHKYVDLPYVKFEDSDKLLDEFKSFLKSDKFIEVQKDTLKENCKHFVDTLTHNNRLTDPKTIVYCGMWGPLGISEVIILLRRLPTRIDKNNLEEVHEYTMDHIEDLSGAKILGDLSERAETIYKYVTSI